MKRGSLIPILGILLIGLVSAFNLNYGTYFNDTSIALGALFVLFFAVINFVLGRTAFGNNTATRTIMSLCISLLAVYGLSTTNFSVQGGYFGKWYIGDYLPTLLTVIFIAGMAFLLYKFKLSRVLIGAGLLLIGLSQTNLIYEKDSVLVVGIILLIIGIFFLWRYKRTPREPRELRARRSRRERRLRPIKEKDWRRRNERLRRQQIITRARNINRIRKRRIKRDLTRENRRRNAFADKRGLPAHKY